LIENSGQFTRDPNELVFTSQSRFIGVPDVYAANDGRLRLIYVDQGSTRGNPDSDLRRWWKKLCRREYDNPFNDLIVNMPGAGNTNVDPAVLRLAGGGYLAVTMRLKRLYLFVSADGRIFSAAQWWSGD
jgi:hypothetical protein